MPRNTRSGAAYKEFEEFLKQKRRGMEQPPTTASESDSESETEVSSSSLSMSTDAEAYLPEQNRGRSKSRANAESYYATETHPSRSKSRSQAESYHSVETNPSRSRSRSVKEKHSTTYNVEPEPRQRHLSRTKISQSVVGFEDRPLDNISRGRSGSRRREADEDNDRRGINVASSSRHRSNSRNPLSKFLVLQIKKIRGMKTFPIVRPYSANMKIRITATFRGIAKASPQILREGAFDPSNLTFMWKISTTEAKIIGDYMEFHVKLTIERDESQGKRKWTHIVGEAVIPGKTGVTIGGRPCTVDLRPTDNEHGRQQLEYIVDLWDEE